MSSRRMTRLTNAFSKKVENHTHQHAINFAYYNFCRILKTLRATPAMAAGIESVEGPRSGEVHRRARDHECVAARAGKLARGVFFRPRGTRRIALAAAILPDDSDLSRRVEYDRRCTSRHLIPRADVLRLGIQLSSGHVPANSPDSLTPSAAVIVVIWFAVRGMFERVKQLRLVSFVDGADATLMRLAFDGWTSS